MWASGAKEESLQFIASLASNLAKDLRAETGDNPAHSSVPKQKLTELSKLLARCYFKTGRWQYERADSWDAVSTSLK